MISTACPECTAYYASLGRCDGGCRPGCPQMFGSPFSADEISDEERPQPKPQQQQAHTHAAPQIRQFAREGVPPELEGLLRGMQEAQNPHNRDRHMSWVRTPKE